MESSALPVQQHSGCRLRLCDPHRWRRATVHLFCPSPRRCGALSTWGNCFHPYLPWGGKAGYSRKRALGVLLYERKITVSGVCCSGPLVTVVSLTVILLLSDLFP